MDALTLWRLKKTLFPSSGHTVRISSFFIPRSSLPVSTPRVFTVLSRKRSENVWCHAAKSQSKNAPFYSHSGEAFLLQPGFDLCRCGVQVQVDLTSGVPLSERTKGTSCHMTSQRGYSAAPRVSLSSPVDFPWLRGPSLAPERSVECCLPHFGCWERATIAWIFESPGTCTEKGNTKSSIIL